MDIVGIGYPCIDCLVNVDRIPLGNTGAPMHANSWQGGGKVSSAMVAAARLGARVGMMGVVGDDIFGRFCREDFVRHGIDVSHLIADPNTRTGFSVPISELETGDRNIIYRPGNCRAMTIDDLDRDYLCAAPYLHLESANPVTRQAARWVREAGGKVGFDVERLYPDLEALTPEIDVYIASEDCYRSQYGQSTDYEAACRAVQARGPEIVVFTLGPGGSVGVAGDAYFEAPTLTIAPVDTTGAGDVYHGAFLYGLAQGWDPAYVARFSNVVAAIKCLRMGGRAGLPDADLTRRVLEAGAVTPDMPGLDELDDRAEFYSQLQI